jgi:hypothetical protein
VIFIIIVVIFLYLYILYIWDNTKKSLRYACMIHNPTPLLRTSGSRGKDEYNDKVEIVCANYNRDVSFMDDFPYLKKVILKGKDVENIGQECTSYLRYIIDNYDNLPDVVIFIHDENESWHHEGKLTEIIPPLVNEFIEMNMNYLEFNSLIYKDCHFIPKLYFGMINNTDLWENVFQKYLGYENITDYTALSYQRSSAQFMVSKKYIQKNPKEFYQALFDWIIVNDDKKLKKISKMFGGPGWILGLFCEYLWFPMFNDKCQVYVEGASGKIPKDLSSVPVDIDLIRDYDVVVKVNGGDIHKDVREYVIDLLETNNHILEKNGMTLVKGYYYRHVSGNVNEHVSLTEWIGSSLSFISRY